MKNRTTKLMETIDSNTSIISYVNIRVYSLYEELHYVSAMNRISFDILISNIPSLQNCL